MVKAITIVLKFLATVYPWSADTILNPIPYFFVGSRALASGTVILSASEVIDPAGIVTLSEFMLYDPAGINSRPSAVASASSTARATVTGDEGASPVFNAESGPVISCGVDCATIPLVTGLCSFSGKATPLTFGTWSPNR